MEHKTISKKLKSKKILKRNKKSRIKNIGSGHGNKKNRNRNYNRYNTSKKNRKVNRYTSPSENISRINYETWEDNPRNPYYYQNRSVRDGTKEKYFLSKNNHTLGITIINGKEILRYYVYATNKSTIKDLKKRILAPRGEKLKKQISEMGLIWGENCILINSKNFIEEKKKDWIRLDDLKDTILLEDIDVGKKNNNNNRFFYPNKQISVDETLMGGSLILFVMKNEFISYGFPQVTEKSTFNPKKLPNDLLKKTGLNVI